MDRVRALRKAMLPIRLADLWIQGFADGNSIVLWLMRLNLAAITAAVGVFLLYWALQFARLVAPFVAAALGLVISIFAIRWIVPRCGALLVRMRAIQKARAEARRVAEVEQKAAEAAHRSRPFDAYCWGTPEPTRKQFGYARSLGVELSDGMTRFSVSHAIDERINELQNAEPATAQQLRQIERMRGVVRGKLSFGQARRAIEYLEDHDFPCPYCEIPNYPTDARCLGCGKKLTAVKFRLNV